MFNDERWLTIDNAGKLFPYISKKGSPNVFRIAFYLKDNINPEILQKAVDDLKYRFPTFFVKMRSGIFWYYYELNERRFLVKEERPFICSYKNTSKNDGYFLEIFYYKNRIAIEVFHAISDANGAVELGKAIVYRYAELLGLNMVDLNNEIIKVGSESKITEYEDSFKANYNQEKLKRLKAPKAYLIKGSKFFAPGHGVIVGKVDSKSLIEIAHKYDCTVTQFLCAVAMKSIYSYMNKHHKKNTLPITVVLPVNMRKFFDSQTLRNFALYIYLIQEIKPNLEIADFIETIKKCYNEQLNKEALQSTLNANMRIETNKLLKLCPLFLKILALKIGYNKIAGGLSSMSVSNLGVVKTPKCLENVIENIEFVISGTNISHINSIVTYNGVTKIAISRIIQELDIEKEYFTTLSKLGLNLTVSSNLWEEN